MRQALSLLVFCVLAQPLFANTTLPTALKPVTIIPHGDVVHVFTSAVDVDYDGERDPGDRIATWQIVDAATLATLRTLEFEWKPVNAARPYHSFERNLMLVGIGDSVIIYDASNQDLVSTLPLGPVSGLYLDEETAAVLGTIRTSFTEPGILKVFVGGEATSIPVGVNPQQITGFTSTVNGNGIIVLNEGSFGQADGTAMVKSGLEPLTTIPVGDTPNHVVVSGDSAYVTVNGSHWVIVIDLNLESAVDTILVGTEGFDGPREALVNDGRLFVTTYAGDIRIFDLVSHERVGYISQPGKPEGLALANGKLWVTKAMTSTYAADSGIVVYELNTATGVQWDGQAEGSPLAEPLAVSPSVASDLLTIERSSITEFPTLVNSAGQTISAPVLSSSEISVTFSVTSLPIGSYTCLQGAKKGRFVVIR